MYNFRKISKRSKECQNVIEKYEKELNSFHEYLRRDAETSETGRVSGKAASYRDYLIKLYVLVNETKDNNDIYLLSYEFLNELNKLRDSDGYSKYNTDEGGFPNATINAFDKYLQDYISEDFDEEIMWDESPDDVEHSDMHEPQKPKKRKTYKGNRYTRSGKVVNAALENSKWKCQIDETHNSFIEKNSDNMFMEVHHIIPLSKQDDFENSLDVVANTVSLCPTCHRLIHHAREQDVEVAVTSLFMKREPWLKEVGIEITLEKLLSFYGIKSNGQE